MLFIIIIIIIIAFFSFTKNVGGKYYRSNIVFDQVKYMSLKILFENVCQFYFENVVLTHI